ncbi:putative Flavin-binding monooxygenase-like-domain-containing protein [Seiridium cardinale]
MSFHTRAPVGDQVCVIGTGVLGLVAIKNLIEQGLDVTAFERNGHLGGNWHVSDDTNQVTATAMTTANTSKQINGFTDFPFGDDVAVHPSSKSIREYLESYARHFDLLQHIKFSTRVLKVERDDATGKWIVHTQDASRSASVTPTQQVFDRLVVATGLLNGRNMVNIPRVKEFSGDVLHSQGFKDAYRYTGKNVLVVGIGATGADTTSFLKKAGAANIYLSHRGQTYLLPRMVDGKAFDHSMSHPLNCIMRYLGSWSPGLVITMMSKGLRSAQFKAFPWLAQHPSFSSPRPLPKAPMLHRVPIFSDDLAENLGNGSVKSVLGIREVTGPRSLKLVDGTSLDDIDAIVICSGYHYDFSLVAGAGNPVDPDKAPEHYRRMRATPYFDPGHPFPRLYHGFISEQYPESLAFLGHMLIAGPPFVMYDLISMALAGLWTGNNTVPTGSEMRKDIDAHYDTIVKALHTDYVHHPGVRVNSKATYEWLNETAGTGVSDHIGNFSITACKVWWNDRKFYNLLMDGVAVPAVYRLFDTGRGRKPWSGARAHIEKVNQEVAQMGEAWKKQEKTKQH